MRLTRRNALCLSRVAPGLVPVVAVGVADAAVGLEELVGNLEDRKHQPALRTPGDMETMTNGKFRHLPVVEDSKVVGLISIGDVVKWRVSEYEREQEALREYIKTA